MYWQFIDSQLNRWQQVSMDALIRYLFRCRLVFKTAHNYQLHYTLSALCKTVHNILNSITLKQKQGTSIIEEQDSTMLNVLYPLLWWVLILVVRCRKSVRCHIFTINVSKFSTCLYLGIVGEQFIQGSNLSAEIVICTWHLGFSPE